MRFSVVEEQYREHLNAKIKLPKRADKGSAGYDFYAPCRIVVPAHGCTGLIKTDVRIDLDEDKVLLLFTRSGNGIFKWIGLKNQVGVIDSSYYDNKATGGNIGIALKNGSDKEIIFEEGDRVMQGVITNFYVTDDDITNGTRTGGFGSSGQ